MLCLKKRRTYSFTQGTCVDLPRRSKKDAARYEGSLNMAITTLPRKNRSREERPSRMVLTVTEDTPADMLAGSMELLVQLPREHHLHTQRVTVQRSTPMMDLLVQIATAHKLAASSYTLQAIGERGLVLPHQPNTPIGALDALQVKLLPKQGTFVPKKVKPANQPFETTFRLQVHLPRNQLYVSRVSPKMNLGEILDEVCREKNLDKHKYELRHPVNLEEILDLSLSLQDYHLQEVTLYAKQGRTLGSALSSQDIMALQRQEERRRQQAKQSVFGFMFKKSKESSVSTDSLEGRSVSPARSDETGRSASPLQPPTRPQRKRRPAPKPPVSSSSQDQQATTTTTTTNTATTTTTGTTTTTNAVSSKEKMLIGHSRNSSDSSGYHEASVLSDNPDSAARLPETLPRRSKAPGSSNDTPRKLAHTSHSSKSLCNLAATAGASGAASLDRALSSSSLSSTGLRKKRAAPPPPPVSRPLSSAISTQALERIDDSEESLTSDMDPSKPPSDIGVPSKASSDIDDHRSKANSDIGIRTNVKIESIPIVQNDHEKMMKNEKCRDDKNLTINTDVKVEDPTSTKVENARVEVIKREIPVERSTMEEPLVPLPKPRKVVKTEERPSSIPPPVPKRRIVPPVVLPRSISKDSLERSPNTLVTNSSEDFGFASSSFSSVSSVGIEFTTINASKMNEDRQNANEDSKINEKLIDKVSLEDTKSIDSSSSSSSGGLQFTVKDATIMNESYRNDTKEDSKINKKSVEKISSVDKRQIRVGARSRTKLSKKHTKSMNDIHTALSSELDHKTCTVISTIPKCDRFESHTRNTPRSSSCGRLTDDSKSESLNYFERNLDDLLIKDNGSICESILESSSKGSKRFMVHRSPSDLNDFEVNSFSKQKRHLTSKSEDIMFALNMNLMLPDEKEFDVETERGQVEGAKAVEGIPDGEKKPLDTDALLHKVSETLSSSSLTSEKPTIVVDHVENTTPTQKSENSRKQRSNGEEKVMNTQNSSTLSQQDTSDYVSALDDDLSVADWEYQLPAPPSAFRDSDSPVIDGYDTVTLRSVEAFKEPADRFDSNVEQTREDEQKTEMIEKRKRKMMEPSMKLTKDVICELESKMGISTLPRSQKESDSKKIGNGNSVTLNIAPIDNHLSNFTITTYTRQKSLDIFDENSPNASNKNSDEMSSNGMVSTESKDSHKDDKELERPISQNKKPEPKITSKEFESTQKWQSVNGVYEKNNVQRSKSHASTMNKPKLKNEMEDCTIERRHENSVDTVDDVAKKSTSITNLNHIDHPRGNEKFSQWRDNILKRQEEPTKEKQLQSIQVLKSILPQLANNQRADENVSKEEEVVLREKPRSETTSNDNSLGPNVLSTNGESHVTARQEDKISASQKENMTKRYTYNGPPAISLGSWAERPTVKVQIKMDTDYKLGRDNVTGATTIVNLNGPKETNDTSYTKNSSKIVGKNFYKKDFIEEERKNERINERKEHDDLTRKLITHTTASGFKKPSLNKVETKMEIPKYEDRPIVTAVELKKTVHQKQEVQKDDKNDNESVIDTTPLNFKELTKAFGQDINLRIKPQRANVNRHSDYYGSQLDVIRKSIEQNNKQQNGHAKPDEFPFRTNVLQKDNVFVNGERSSTNSDGKKFTSIVGINSQVYQNQNTQKNNVSFKNNVNNFKAKGPMPVVKGFKVTTPFAESKTGKDIGASNQNGSLPRNETNKVSTQPPKPPTMPVIMGVTLKSANARPKSTPVHVESRDMLLESIRNFGGREKLRNTTERY